MKFKEKLSRIIRDTISNYDFEDVINYAIDSIDIEDEVLTALQDQFEAS